MRHAASTSPQPIRSSSGCHVFDEWPRWPRPWLLRCSSNPSQSRSLIASECAVYEASSFAIQPNYLHSKHSLASAASCSSSCPGRWSTKHTDLYSATIRRSNSRDNQSHRTRRTPTINKQLELETIRKELIQKYLSLGHSLEDATREVEYFFRRQGEESRVCRNEEGGHGKGK